MGIEDPRTVSACIDLGICYEEQGLFKEASTLYESTIAEIKTVCSETHPSIKLIQEYNGWVLRMLEEEEQDEDISNRVDNETDEETDRETDEDIIDEVEDYSSD